MRLETKVLRRDPSVLSDAIFGDVGADSVAYKSVRRNDVRQGTCCDVPLCPGVVIDGSIDVCSFDDLNSTVRLKLLFTDAHVSFV